MIEAAGGFVAKSQLNRVFLQHICHNFQYNNLRANTQTFEFV